MNEIDKELKKSFKNFSIYFYYDEFELSDSECEDFSQIISTLCQVFYAFLVEEASLKEQVFSLNLNLCSDEKIQQLNEEYRQKNYATDVLSFPLQENLVEGHYDQFLNELELGDLFIAKDYCWQQAQKFKLSFREEFLHLSVHGFLHLVGYDHELGPKEEKLMESLEEKLLDKIRVLNKVP